MSEKPDRMKMNEAAVTLDRYIIQKMSAAIGMQSIGRLITLAEEVTSAAFAEGEYCEFGCHACKTAAFIQLLMPPDRTLWLYDSFRGNPCPGELDGIPPEAPEHMKQGGNKTSLEECLSNIHIPFNPTCAEPKFIPGFIEDLTPKDLPAKIAFAHIDCNFYNGTRAALNLLKGQRVRIVVDDCFNPDYPGVFKAVTDFCVETGSGASRPTTEPGGSFTTQAVIHLF